MIFNRSPGRVNANEWIKWIKWWDLVSVPLDPLAEGYVEICRQICIMQECGINYAPFIHATAIPNWFDSVCFMYNWTGTDPVCGSQLWMFMTIGSCVMELSDGSDLLSVMSDVALFWTLFLMFHFTVKMDDLGSVSDTHILKGVIEMVYGFDGVMVWC